MRRRGRKDQTGSLEPLVTVEEAAAFLGVRLGTVYLWAEMGRIPSYKIGALRRFRLSDLEAHLYAHREGGDHMGAPKNRSVVDGIMPDDEAW
ncbi:MAG: helix-turn-helix domain-containing protein [Actinomycetota bacterium]